MMSDVKNISTTSQILYNSFNHDLSITNGIYFFQLDSLFQSEYTDTLSNILILSPELTTVFVDFIGSFIKPSQFNNFIASAFDSYMSVWNNNTGVEFILFGSLYVYI
jgi:hypothetical protein